MDFAGQAPVGYTLLGGDRPILGGAPHVVEVQVLEVYTAKAKTTPHTSHPWQ